MNNLRYGELIYQWMRSVTQFSGLPFERRSVSVIEYDLSGLGGWEVNRQGGLHIVSSDVSTESDDRCWPDG